MIRSMTGFGEASTHEDGVHYFLELRSLNNKYFKAGIRFPDDLQGLEPELESELRRRLTRGTITAIGKRSNTSSSAAYEINHHALGHYVEQIRRTSQFSDGGVQIDLGALLALPGVLQPPADEEARLETGRRIFMVLLDKACANLLAMRRREGAVLVEDLMMHRELIRRHLARIGERAPDVVQEFRKRLQSRIEVLLAEAGVTLEPTDLIREVAVFAEKSDISEEVQRLTAHLDQFADLLTKNDGRPVGRTLDFLAQEMLREANTIASKSGDAEISRDIVEIKGAIDRIKEQVQNIE